MPLALYYKPSYERLKDRIDAIAPDLDVALYDEEGRIHYQGREVAFDDIKPEYFWVHSDLFFSPRLKDYFRLMHASTSIKWLHTINTGLDQLPYLELVEKGIVVTNNHSQAIAIGEFVLGQVLAWYQGVLDFHAKQVQKTWQHRGFREIMGSNWVIIGFGHIGQAVARRAKPFGASITAVRRSRNDEGLADVVTDHAGLMQALPHADVVVLACTSTPETRHMANAAFFAAMKDKSVLVNVARGDLVQEDDLHAALEQGKPEHAILDVFATEPLPQDSWIWNHPRVTVTPHTSNGGSGMRARSEAVFFENLARIQQGEALLNKVSRSDIV